MQYCLILWPCWAYLIWATQLVPQCVRNPNLHLLYCLCVTNLEEIWIDRLYISTPIILAINLWFLTNSLICSMDTIFISKSIIEYGMICWPTWIWFVVSQCSNTYTIYPHALFCTCYKFLLPFFWNCVALCLYDSPTMNDSSSTPLRWI